MGSEARGDDGGLITMGSFFSFHFISVGIKNCPDVGAWGRMDSAKAGERVCKTFGGGIIVK